MGVPTLKVGYTFATTKRKDHEVNKNMWWNWEKKKSTLRVGNTKRLIVPNKFSILAEDIPLCLSIILKRNKI
jgi:hypothetical protein